MFDVAQFTVNTAVPVPPFASLAATKCAPADAPPGTWKTPTKLPPDVDVIVAGTVVCVEPSNLIVIVEEAAKLVPVTVTASPPRPEMGLNVIAAPMTVKIALAAFPLASDAMTEWGPPTEEGTAKVAEKDPPEVVTIAGGTVTCTTPSYVTWIADVPAKLDPVTVTVVPPGPEIGFNVILGLTTVNRAVAVFAEASVALTV